MSTASGNSRQLHLLAGTYAVCRLAADAPWPAWAAGEFVSLTRTGDELSVVCRAESVPDGVRVEGGWCCLRLAGPIDFTAVGVLASLVEPLANAGLGVFAVSTFDTDYLLVRATDLGRALEVLRAAGYAVE